MHHQRICLGLHRRHTSAFPVSVQHMPAEDGGHAYSELTWRLTEMPDLKHFKEAVVCHRLPFVKEM